jgi:hypothetical protein
VSQAYGKTGIQESHLYRARNLVERFFNKINIAVSQPVVGGLASPATQISGTGGGRADNTTQSLSVRRQGTERWHPGVQSPQPTPVRRGLRGSNGRSIVPCPCRRAWSCRIEEVVKTLRVQSRARISHRAGRRILRRADKQLSRPLAHYAHRLDGVDNQVKHHLLQLDSISLNERQVLREPGLQRDAIPQHFAACQGDDL